MKIEEEIGVNQLDILSIDALPTIQRAIRLVEENHNVKIDLDNIPMDDEATYDLLCEGRTLGVFQLGGQGMVDLVTKLKPRTLEDIAPVVSLHRPGPMQSGMEYDGRATQFHGYAGLQHEGQVLAIYKEGNRVDSIEAGDEAVIVLDHTPFYAESGGQVGDRGVLLSDGGAFTVAETQKIQVDVFGHRGQLQSGRLALNNKVSAKVDQVARARTERNHSVTHLMHKALREVLGDHVEQKGSLVDADKTRFDFVHNLPMTEAEISKVEAMVNAEIFTNTATKTRVMKMEDAQKTGAVMLFGEKYGEEVRVLEIGSSRELCGGTHVNRTGDIGLFKVCFQSGIAAGIRRIEAVTGEAALEYVQQNEIQLLEIAKALKTQPEEATQKIFQITDNVRRLEKNLSRLKLKLASSQADNLINQAREIKDVKVLAASL